MLGVWHHQGGEGDREEGDCLPGVGTIASHLHQLVIDGHDKHTSGLFTNMDHYISLDFLSLFTHKLYSGKATALVKH